MGEMCNVTISPDKNESDTITNTPGAHNMSAIFRLAILIPYLLVFIKFNDFIQLIINLIYIPIHAATKVAG